MRIILALVIASMTALPVYSSEDPGQETFGNAIAKGDLAAVQKLVEEQPDRVNAVLTIGKGKSFKMSALCMALSREHKAIAEYLLSKGADPRQGPQSYPPLDIASQQGYSDMIPLLVKHGDNPNPDPEITERSPLSVAKDIQTAKALIACGADVRHRDKYGKTPVHHLSPFAKIDIVELLLQKGADVNAKDKQGRTALHEAARECQLEMAAFLLDHGADVNAGDIQNLTPLEYSVQIRSDSRGSPDKPEYYKTLRLLISKGARHTAEHLVRAGDLERLKTLFAEKPEQKNFQDRFGKSLLLCAIQEGQARVAEFLLQQGADVNAAGQYSPPPLHTAVYTGNPDIVKMLLKAGADIHGKGKEGESALHWVAIRPQRETEAQAPYDQIARIIIDAGSEINGQAKKGRPDMPFGMEQAVDEIGEFLRMEAVKGQIVQIGAPRWLAYNAGDTPLHSAGRWGRGEIVRRLLDAGAKVDIANDYGQTALHYAIAAKHTEIVKILLDARADPNATMKDGMSASELAEKMHHPEALELLKSHWPVQKENLERQSPAVPVSTPVMTPESLRSLSDADLLRTYESTALAAGATDAPISSLNPPDYDEHCLLIKAEILHRGSTIVPLLAAALKTEVTVNRPEAPGHFTPGLVTDEIQLLTQIGDPQAVAPLLDIVETPNDSKHEEFRDPRYQALGAVEKLTFVCFHKVKPHFGNYSDTVQHPGAVDLERFSRTEFPKAVHLYRDWIAGEGKDSGQWLAMARKRARAFLECDDLDDAYCGASFLTEPFNRDALPRIRDDMPDRTLQRIGQILGGAEPIPGGKRYDYQYHGKALPILLYNWVSFLTAYGPRARPFAGILIRFQNETGLNNWSGLQEMAKVGGPEIMAFYFNALPVINEEVDTIRNDPATPKGFSSDDPRGWWLDAQQVCRAGIDRWAGRRFESDDARGAWWKANKDKSSEQWLRDSLPLTAASADAGDEYDVRLFRQLFPEAPYGTDEPLRVTARIAIPGTTPLPLRKKWFDQHRFEFAYDPHTGTFRLPDVPAR